MAGLQLLELCCMLACKAVFPEYKIVEQRFIPALEFCVVLDVHRAMNLSDLEPTVGRPKVVLENPLGGVLANCRKADRFPCHCRTADFLRRKILNLIRWCFVKVIF